MPHSHYGYKSAPFEPIDYGDPAAVEERTKRMWEQFGKFFVSRKKGSFAPIYNDVAEKCHACNPMISTEQFLKELLDYSPRRLYTLRFLADTSTGMSINDVSIYLNLAPKVIKQWLRDPKYTFLLDTLTTGYRLGLIKPLIVEVIVEGLNRRYQTDVYCETSDSSGKGAAITHKQGERIFDSVTVGLIKEGKALIGEATDVTKDVTLPGKVDAKEDARKAAELLKNPEIMRVMKKVAQVEKELPDEVKVAAVAADGELMKDDDVTD